MYRFLCHWLISAKATGAMLVCSIEGDDYEVEAYKSEIHSTEFLNGLVIVGSPQLLCHEDSLRSMPRACIDEYLAQHHLLDIHTGEIPAILHID